MGRSSKDKRDIFYRLAKEEGWRARSAFKLLQINSQFDILSSVSKAVDLCAAPGSWSQVLSQSLFDKPNTQIVAVDLQSMAPIPGVICLQGDITSESTAIEIIRLLGDTKAELVVCDGAPDVTGLHHLDEYLQGQLLLSALNIASCVLQNGGTFVAKMFRSSKSGVETIFSKVGLFFENVVIAKPRSSRASSIESFIVARGFRLPPNYTARLGDPMLRYNPSSGELTDVEKIVIPFVTCGDLSGYDADTTYALPKDYEYHEPVQSPISPPYEEAISRKKASDNVACGSSNSTTTVNSSTVLMDVTVEFSGGAELHVGGIKEKTVKVSKDMNMKNFLIWMKDNLIKERPELLIKGNDVRPGILVLINDTDWELMDKTDYCLLANDKVTFISTLHGG